MSKEALQQWVASQLRCPITTFEPVAGDASFRQYLRARTTQASYIIMDSPPSLEDPKPFVAIANAWQQAGLNVPKIIATDMAKGWLILSDLGDELYVGLESVTDAHPHYMRAMDALLTLREAPEPPNYPYPIFDKDHMQREMGYFREWFLPHHLQYQMSHMEQTALAREIATLLNSIENLPKVVVHRDFIVRNLLVCPQASPGIIDFQDAVRGPVLYDCVTLLRDANITWSEQQVWSWLHYFWYHADLGISFPKCQLWFDWISLQRHLKVLGIFARLAYRDEKKQYLHYMPRIAGFVHQTLSRHPEFRQLRTLFEQHIQPFMAAWASSA